jgi:hypothetical protein
MLFEHFVNKIGGFMELFIVMFMVFGAIGVATTKDEKSKTVTYDKKQTRLIQQTRQTVYDSEVIQEWK